jgi:Dimerisation domain
MSMDNKRADVGGAAAAPGYGVFMSSSPVRAIPANAALNEMLLSASLVQAISVAAELGIADALTDGPRSAADLAQAVGANPPALYRLLRALSSAGVFCETADCRFEHTPLSECLRSNSASSMRSWARLLGADWHHRFICGMLHSVRSGEEIVERTFGVPLWEYFAQNKEQATLCNESMTNFSSTEVAAILDRYDFAPRGSRWRPWNAARRNSQSTATHPGHTQ